MTSDLVWTSTHVYRHDDLDDLLVTGLAPLAAELAADGLVHGFFYLRYWEGGPHVRVRLLTPAERTDSVRRHLREGLADHLRKNPSRSPTSPAIHAIRAARAAELENRSSYDQVLRTPDTIEDDVYVPDHASFGHGRSLAAAERHFCRSTALALAALQTARSRRLSLAMVTTLATMVVAPPSTSVPRHARPTGLAAFDRAEADAAWCVSREELSGMVARLRAADAGQHPDVPALAWMLTVSALRDDLLGITLPHPLPQLVHRCLHLHLNRLGITPSEEARLRYLASQAIGSECTP